MQYPELIDTSDELSAEILQLFGRADSLNARLQTELYVPQSDSDQSLRIITQCRETAAHANYAELKRCLSRLDACMVQLEANVRAQLTGDFQPDSPDVCHALVNNLLCFSNRRMNATRFIDPTLAEYEDRPFEVGTDAIFRAYLWLQENSRESDFLESNQHTPDWAINLPDVISLPRLVENSQIHALRLMGEALTKCRGSATQFRLMEVNEHIFSSESASDLGARDRKKSESEIMVLGACKSLGELRAARALVSTAISELIAGLRVALEHEPGEQSINVLADYSFLVRLQNFLSYSDEYFQPGGLNDRCVKLRQAFLAECLETGWRSRYPNIWDGQAPLIQTERLREKQAARA